MRSLLLLILIFLAGCTLHPTYERPNVEVSETWRISVNEASSYCNIDWWEQFGDPELTALIMEAIRNNNDLKVAIGRVSQYVGQLEIVQSGLYPQVNFNGVALKQAGSIDFTPLPIGIKRVSDNFTCLFNASFDLDLWGSIRSASEAARAQLFAQVEARRTVVLNIVASVANTYIDLKQYYEQLRISRDTYKSRVEAYDIAVLRYHGGLTSDLEPNQAKAEMESAAAQILEFETYIARDENLISLLIGHPPQAIELSVPLNDLNLASNVPAGIPSDIMEQRPDIMQAEWNLVAANAEIGVARAQFFPNISLTGLYGNESAALKNLFTGPARMWSYGGSLLQPIFMGGALIGQLHVTEAQKYQAYYQYQQAVLNAFREVDDALIVHQKSQELLVVQKRRVEALVKVLSLATIQYENGQVDYLNVLNARRDLFVAQLDEAETKSDTFLSLVNIYKSLGGGWVIEADAMAIAPTVQ